LEIIAWWDELEKALDDLREAFESFLAPVTSWWQDFINTITGRIEWPEVPTGPSGFVAESVRQYRQTITVYPTINIGTITSELDLEEVQEAVMDGISEGLKEED